MKDVVDVTGNTVAGVLGAVTGVGMGLGNIAAHGGFAIGKSLGFGDSHRDIYADSLTHEENMKANAEECKKKEIER